MELYRAIAGVLVKMHRRGVFFRNLSADNLLLRRAGDCSVEFALIGTGRARFAVKSISPRQRLVDLIRLCHPLVKRERERFLPVYFEVAGIRSAPWMRLVLHY